MRVLLACLFAILMPVAAAAQQADDDVGYLAGLLQDALSGAGRNLQIRGFQGALSSEASIALIAISDDEGEWFRAENVTLIWARSALLRGAIDVDEFSADRILISRAPVAQNQVPSAEATPLSIPNLPVSVEIETLRAGSVVLGEALAGEEAELTVDGSASLNGQAFDLQFALNRVDGKTARIDLAANYDPDTRNLTVDLRAEEDADGIFGTLLDIPRRPALSLGIDGEGSVEDFEARVSLDTDGQPRLSGTVGINSPENDQSWNINVDLDGDLTPLLTEEMQAFFGDDVGLTADLIRDASGRIVLPEFSLSAQSLSLDGTATISETGWPEQFNVNGRLRHPEDDLVALPFGGGTTKVADATFSATLDEDLTVDAQLQALQTEDASFQAITLSGQGNIDPQTLADDGQVIFDLDLLASGMDFENPSLQDAIGSDVTGQMRVDYLAGQPVRVTNLDLSGSDYGLKGEVTFDPDKTIPLELDLRVIAENIRRFSGLAGRSLAGRAEVTAKGAVGLVSGMADLVIDGTTLDLQVGQEVADRILTGIGSARIDVRRDETGTTFRQARIVTTGANLSATGKITSEETALRFGGELRSLDRIFPGEADGRADVTGSIALKGLQLRSMSVDANLTNQSEPVRLPFLNGMLLETGTVTLTATGGPSGTWEAKINVNDLDSNVLSSDALAVDGSGALSQEESGAIATISGNLDATSSNLRMSDRGLSQALGRQPSTNMTFAWSQADARLDITQFDVNTGALDATGTALLTQVLTQPNAQFSATLDAESFAPLSELVGQPLRGNGSLDVMGSYRVNGPFDVQIDGQANRLALGNSTIDRLLTGTTTIDAAVTGTRNQVERIAAEVRNPELSAQVSGPLAALDITAQLRDLGLIAPDFSGPARVDGLVEHGNGRVAVDLDLDGPGGTRLAVNGDVRNGRTANIAINGEAPLGLANTFIAPRRLNGRANLDLALVGPLALTSVSGTVTPAGAEFSAPTLGIVLAPITGQIRVENGAALVGLSATGNQGGTVDVNGQLGLRGFDAALTATLTSFGVQDPSLYDTSVDGTVQLTGPIGRDLLISGDLRLNETEIQVPSSGSFALGDIPNIEHLGATRPVLRTIERAGLTSNGTETQPAGGATARLDLSLTAPNQVFVRGRGLDAELGGSLRLTGPTNDIIPQGGFDLVRGRLDVLNQRFLLDEGRIQLSGSFLPVLRFVASTEANGIVVNVILDGPASAPDISFTSTPELPEDEILAQLLFGRNLSNLSALQALELANAVATLAGGGAGGLLSDLRDGFGLDDLDVSQTEDGGTAVRAGAYISENVYTDVVVESGGRTEINLNLDITPEITARGSVGNDGNSSVGIFFERDY